MIHKTTSISDYNDQVKCLSILKIDKGFILIPMRNPHYQFQLPDILIVLLVQHKNYGQIHQEEAIIQLKSGSRLYPVH